ncbi:MAG: cell division protein FtsQ/DivIB [Candidatus Aminicenantia bacterium]
MNRSFREPMRYEANFWRKRSRVSLTRNRRENLFRKISSMLIIIIPVVIFYIGFAETFYYLKNWEYFGIKYININTPNEKIKGEISEIVKSLSSKNILFADTGAIENMIRENPYVKEVNIKKVLPSTIEIFLEIRKEIAVLKDRNFHILDEGAEVIKEVERAGELPVISGVTLDDKIEIKLGIDILKEFKEKKLDKFIEEIDVSNPLNIKVKIRGSQTMVFLGESDFSQRLERFLRLKNTIESEIGGIEYIGFLDKNRIYIKTSGIKKEMYR